MGQSTYEVSSTYVAIKSWVCVNGFPWMIFPTCLMSKITGCQCQLILASSWILIYISFVHYVFSIFWNAWSPSLSIVHEIFFSIIFLSISPSYYIATYYLDLCLTWSLLSRWLWVWLGLDDFPLLFSNYFPHDIVSPALARVEANDD